MCSSDTIARTDNVTMSVTLDPPELGFRRTSSSYTSQTIWLMETITGPFTHEVTQMLRLRNPSNDPIAFKVC